MYSVFMTRSEEKIIEDALFVIRSKLRVARCECERDLKLQLSRIEILLGGCK